MIHTAQIASNAHRSGVFRAADSDCFVVEMESVRNRKRKMVEGLVDAHRALYKGSGAELIMGAGTFTAPRTVKVDLNDGTKRVLRGENAIVVFGSERIERGKYGGEVHNRRQRKSDNIGRRD